MTLACSVTFHIGDTPNNTSAIRERTVKKSHLAHLNPSLFTRHGFDYLLFVFTKTHTHTVQKGEIAWKVGHRIRERDAFAIDE